ncbi:M48 family metalloprotease [Candidatus Bathyarchaeota archaeon]|jgi:Zn-dependent protease with chaperone function|nr:M48 family metalloprotease [Candidatus Bathyarchaeota archaeon]
MSKALTNLDPREYEHPFDRMALDALQKTPGVDKLVAKLNAYSVDRLLRVRCTGSFLRVTPRNFPDVFQAFEAVCETLNLSDTPELYLQWDYSVNGFTGGVERPIVVLTSGAIDLLEDGELLYLIGHEVGHIKSGHVLYHQMAEILPGLGQLIGAATLGLGQLVSMGVQLALLNWHRMSEFTADRAGLLACQDVDAATKALMKMAGLPKRCYGSAVEEEFIRQARDFEGPDFDSLDKVAKIVSIAGATHPWTVMRASEFYKWIESGEYAQVLSREAKSGTAAQASATGFCMECGSKLAGHEKFCTECGHQVMG